MVLNPSSRIHAFFLQRILLLFCPSTSCLLHPLSHHQVRIWGHQALDIQEYVVHVPRKHRVNPLVHNKTPLTYLILSMLKCQSKVANGLYESLCRFNDITIDNDTPWKEFLLCVSILIDDFHLLQNSRFARLTAPYDWYIQWVTRQNELKGAIERGMGISPRRRILYSFSRRPRSRSSCRSISVLRWMLLACSSVWHRPMLSNRYKVCMNKEIPYDTLAFWHTFAIETLAEDRTVTAWIEQCSWSTRDASTALCSSISSSIITKRMKRI